MGKGKFKSVLKWSSGILLFLVLGLAAAYYFLLYNPPAITAEDRAQIELMPLPAKLSLNGGTLNLSSGIHPIFTTGEDPVVKLALERWAANTGLKIHEEGVPIAFNIANTVENFELETEEFYDINISSGSIEISAGSTFGALHAIETLRQLRTTDADYSILTASITDKPLYPWRGLMVDVSRHFIPTNVIYRLLESMSAVKMNVFHWHLSDDQGFRVESKRYPKLHEIGSNGSYYTQEEIKDILEFARVRGIRIIPEFDLPGHSKSWQMAYPQLASISDEQTFGMKSGIGFTAPIDPTREEVYTFLDSLVGEMAALFPDPDFHIGADEVNATAWDNNPQIQEFMSSRDMYDAHDLQAYFVMRMQKILARHGKRMLGWDEILNPSLDSGIVVQAWTSHKALFEAVQQGSSGILSTGLYLDHILPASEHYAVDPRVLPGAVEIVPDSGYWKMYDQSMEIGGNVMESQMVIFDRDPDNVFGYMAMLSDRIAFEGGKLENDKLTFTMMGPVGELSYEAQFSGDSLAGSIGFGLLSFESSGVRSGGSDMPGTEMPVIEIIRPLTAEEESRILGGEACQWAEFVDSTNVESRIWPRAAVIAEKLWSPVELTTDVDDMYRRLEALSAYLTIRGSQHEKQLESKLAQLIPSEGLPALRTLTQTLQEVKYHGRIPDLMAMPYVYLPEYQLDRVVDAVHPESFYAVKFNARVDNYLENKSKEDLEAILTELDLLSANHALLAPFIAESEKLKEVENLSQSLSRISSEIAKKLRTSNTAISADTTAWNVLNSGENGVVLGILPGLQKLNDL